jgi:predicted phosphodiesterase
MRIAVFSDTHGNTIAQSAVLADIERAGGVDAYWFVGDAVALGFDPVGTIQHLRALPGLKAVRGNTDRDTVRDADDIDSGFLARTSQLPEQAPRTLAILRNVAWTRGALMATGHLEWLASLPVEERVTLPDGTRVLLVHAAPGTDDGPGIRAEQSDEELAGILAGANADLVIVGHTHLPMERTVNGVRAWNLGSVSLPFTGEKRAMWTLLEADEEGYRLERRFTGYDTAEVLARLNAISPPGEGVLRWTLAKAD